MAKQTWLQRARDLASYGVKYDPEIYRLAGDAAEAFDTARMFRTMRGKTGALATAAKEHRKGLRLYHAALARLPSNG